MRQRITLCWRCCWKLALRSCRESRRCICRLEVTFGLVHLLFPLWPFQHVLKGLNTMISDRASLVYCIVFSGIIIGIVVSELKQAAETYYFANFLVTLEFAFFTTIASNLAAPAQSFILSIARVVMFICVAVIVLIFLGEQFQSKLYLFLTPALCGIWEVFQAIIIIEKCYALHSFVARKKLGIFRFAVWWSCLIIICIAAFGFNWKQDNFGILCFFLGVLFGLVSSSSWCNTGLIVPALIGAFQLFQVYVAVEQSSSIIGCFVSTLMWAICLWEIGTARSDVVVSNFLITVQTVFDPRSYSVCMCAEDEFDATRFKRIIETQIRPNSVDLRRGGSYSMTSAAVENSSYSSIREVDESAALLNRQGRDIESNRLEDSLLLERRVVPLNSPTMGGVNKLNRSSSGVELSSSIRVGSKEEQEESREKERLLAASDDDNDEHVKQSQLCPRLYGICVHGSNSSSSNSTAGKEVQLKYPTALFQFLGVCALNYLFQLYCQWKLLVPVSDATLMESNTKLLQEMLYYSALCSWTITWIVYALSLLNHAIFNRRYEYYRSYFYSIGCNHL